MSIGRKFAEYYRQHPTIGTLPSQTKKINLMDEGMHGRLGPRAQKYFEERIRGKTFEDISLYPVYVFGCLMMYDGMDRRKKREQEALERLATKKATGLLCRILVAGLGTVTLWQCKRHLRWVP